MNPLLVVVAAMALAAFGTSAQDAAKPSNPAAPAPALTFVRSDLVAEPAVEQGVTIVDVNGDGTPDACFQGERTRIFLGDGRGGFKDSGRRLNARAFYPVVADYDGNGAPDLLVGVTIFLNDGKGAFAAQAPLVDVKDAFWADTRVADVDGDGDLDIMATLIPDAVYVFINEGKGRFRDSGQRLGHGAIGKSVIGSLAVGDVDGDGTVDAVTAGWRSEPGDPCSNRVWLNDGQGSFRDGGQLLDEGISHVHGAALLDLDGDRRPELVLAIQDRNRSGRIWRNDGKGRFAAGPDLEGSGGERITIADVDGDGRPDAVIPGTREPSRVWLNDGNGTLRLGAILMTGRWDWHAGVGDFDGDGRMDLVTVGFTMGEDRKPVATAPQIWLRR